MEESWGGHEGASRRWRASCPLLRDAGEAVGMNIIAGERILGMLSNI